MTHEPGKNTTRVGTCREHAFEARLLIDSGPQDELRRRSFVAKGQETER